jgi:hypothetical protein
MLAAFVWLVRLIEFCLITYAVAMFWWECSWEQATLRLPPLCKRTHLGESATLRCIHVFLSHECPAVPFVCGIVIGSLSFLGSFVAKR